MSDGLPPVLGDTQTERQIERNLNRLRQIEAEIDAIRDEEHDGSAAYYLAMDEINELEDEFVAIDQELFKLYALLEQGKNDV